MELGECVTVMFDGAEQLDDPAHAGLLGGLEHGQFPRADAVIHRRYEKHGVDPVRRRPERLRTIHVGDDGLDARATQLANPTRVRCHRPHGHPALCQLGGDPASEHPRRTRHQNHRLAPRVACQVILDH